MRRDRRYPPRTGQQAPRPYAGPFILNRPTLSIRKLHAMLASGGALQENRQNMYINRMFSCSYLAGGVGS